MSMRGFRVQESPPEFTELMREDLLYRLECARESGYLNLTYHLWPEIPNEASSRLRAFGHAPARVRSRRFNFDSVSAVRNPGL